MSAGLKIVSNLVHKPPVMKALKDAYPKLGDVKDGKGLVDALKDIKDPKEVVRNMVAAGLLQNLEIFKTVQDMQ
jgi:hypothetical protein